MEYGEMEVLDIKENCVRKFSFHPTEKIKLVSFYMYFKG